jgi:hypothetical protein
MRRILSSAVGYGIQAAAVTPRYLAVTSLTALKNKDLRSSVTLSQWLPC